MAYNKVSNKIKEKDINYLSKDFSSFKSKLKNFAQSYFPNTYNDFSESNPATMFLEMAAYVGDVLSFYTDTQIKETFLNTAQERENIYNIAYSLGYQPKVTAASNVNLEVFQVVPSLPSSQYIPDLSYALTISEGSTFKTDGNVSFYTTKDLRFNVSSSLDPTNFSVYKFDGSGNPEYYLLKKSVRAVSAESKTKEIEVGQIQKYKTLNLFDDNIIQIESVVDSEGNSWEEVEYLAQDTKFVDLENIYSNDPKLAGSSIQTPYLLKIKKVPRRFVTRFLDNDNLQLQFGAGISDKSDEEIIPNPDNIGLGIKDGFSKLDIAYDPSNFMYTRAYGQVPSNTTLTVTYLKGGGLESNVGSNTIVNKGFVNITSQPNLNGGLLNFVQSSVGVTNPEPAKGGGSGDTLEELRLNAMANFSTQKRTVTLNDYIIRTLSMPSKFGTITKAHIVQDDQISPSNTGETNRIPNPLGLCLYTLGYDGNKKLTTLNNATKTNLATYLEQYRMLTDAINIKDAFIINIGLDFSITTFKSFNNQQVLLDCINELKSYFNIDRWQINQPIIISEIENLIGGVQGVQTVEEVTLNNKTGISIGYSQYKYDLERATTDGVIYPSLDPSIFELKFPTSDIQGRVTTY